jgi:predicted phage terminase large subunit-like protein
MEDLDKYKKELLSSLLLFTKFFYKIRTGRSFDTPQPIARESHYINVSRALTKTLTGKSRRLIINCPPRYGKSELCIHYIAWIMAHYPDSHNLYISYSHSLAKAHTQIIRQIISMPEYKALFGIEISDESSAKDNFETNYRGSIYAAGAEGTITGRGAGIQNAKRFGGAIIIDDIHKPNEVVSDVMRQNVKDWYLNTLQSRVNSPYTPIIFIGQRLHEDDLAANLMDGYDGDAWQRLIIPALDIANNALLPLKHTKEQLLSMAKFMPYEFSSQYQQEPQPAGGSLFKPEWFVLMDLPPKIISTFITVDTAETDKNYNDATVFSFWGLYKVEVAGIETDLYALHWLDCMECWIEPKDLKDNFIRFYGDCMRFEVKPYLAAIEKKSTGVTLISLMKDIQGIQIFEIERNANAGNKTARFLAAQPSIANKLISLPATGKHTKNCIEHMSKITANESHRYDDIADTCADAIRLGLIDKIIISRGISQVQDDTIADKVKAFYDRQTQARVSTWQ